MKMIKVRLSTSIRNLVATGITMIALLGATAPASLHGRASDHTVVWITAPTLIKTSEATMTNEDKSFEPPGLIITAGSTVRFPNEDPFYHSIYSLSKSDPFDIGYYGTGPGKIVAFNTPGIVDIHCHIHVFMHATILVVDGPYAVAKSGRYEIANLPAGTYALHFWNGGDKITTRTITITGATNVNV